MFPGVTGLQRGVRQVSCEQLAVTISTDVLVQQPHSGPCLLLCSLHPSQQATYRHPEGGLKLQSEQLHVLQEPVKPAAKKAKAGKDVDVSAAQGSTTVFIKNLPWAAGEDELYEFFKDCGEAVEIRVGESSGLCPCLQRCCLPGGPCMSVP